ncbi:Mu transposase C-terminal domain-containing protein [Rhodocyclus gracilis]|uniref:Mu transposase C-terminal domain-containing protein n=1 Tax=Rhodocyclus gracilis TaxID=2929842 RepID=UPI001ADB6F04|nr:Mu transposase C-terminal domain-containing protein [Rhodocyclus gracilis]
MQRGAMIKRIAPATPGGAVAVRPAAQVLALRQRDPWREATERARQVAVAREGVVLYVRGLTDTGVTQNNAVSLLLERGLAGSLPPHVGNMLAAAAKAGRSAPSRSSICEWCAQYREGGISALLPDHKGRVVEAAGWWGPALEYFNAPSKPDMSAVHRKLVEVDGFAVSYDQVRNYLTGVPAMLGRNSPARIGKNLYRLTEKAYIRRSTENALPGDVYVADGYRADVYLAHPMTGDIWRPELTVAMDMRSRFPVHWRADEHEGTYAVQNMWAECFAKWNHVPPFLYVDNGSGHKNRLMSDDMTGFYARAGIQQIIHAIPGNPHGKGWIERFFRSMRDDFLKLWHPELYCGDDMAPEALNRTVADVKAGRLQLPSLAEFAEAFNAWINRYVSRPHPEDSRVTRAELWARLVPIPPAGNVTELKRQALLLTVSRAMVKHAKRFYKHPDLHAFNGQKLMLEYDLMDNTVGVMRTPEGRWICDAHLVSEIDAIAPSRLEEKRQARVEDAMKRLQKKMDEQKARAGLLIDADAVADGAVLETTATRLLEASSDDEINLFEL